MHLLVYSKKAALLLGSYAFIGIAYSSLGNARTLDLKSYDCACAPEQIVEVFGEHIAGPDVNGPISRPFDISNHGSVNGEPGEATMSAAPKHVVIKPSAVSEEIDAVKWAIFRALIVGVVFEVWSGVSPLFNLVFYSPKAE